MGNVVESCKQHIHCCNNDDKIVETETDEYSESLSSSGEHENDNDDATDDNNKIEGSQKDLIDMRVKVNDLVMERQISPWKYYKHLLTLGSGTYGTVKRLA